MKTLKPLTLIALMAALGLALAQTVTEISKQVQTNLEKSAWEANVVGKIQLPDGSSQDTDFLLLVIPGKDSISRVEFRKPSALEGNFVVISDKEVWNYLFLTNQVIIQSRAKAKVEGLGINLTSLGDFGNLTETVTTKLAGDVQSAEGSAWKITGTPKDPNQGYASMEIWVLKSDPRPVFIGLKDAAGKTVASLNIKSFKRTNLTAKALRKYPADAEVIKK